MDPVITMPQIAADEFLRIFVVATLVLVFGVGYAALITLSKMGVVSKKMIPLGYIFWILQVYCLYDLSVLIHSSQFTAKVLTVAMLAYLFAPHLYFYLIEQSEKRYGDSEES